MDPSKPNEPSLDQGRSIPRSRPSDDEVLEGEIIGKDQPLGRPSAVPPPPPQPPKRGLGLRKTLLLVVAVVVVGLCVGGSLTAYFLYDKATTPERSDPSASLKQYVTAKIDSRDEIRVRLFTCSNPELRSVDDLLAQIKEKEAQTGIRIRVSLADLLETRDGSSARIEGKLYVTSTEPDGAIANVIQHWEFTLIEADGWRVCGAKKLPS